MAVVEVLGERQPTGLSASLSAHSVIENLQRNFRDTATWREQSKGRETQRILLLKMPTRLGQWRHQTNQRRKSQSSSESGGKWSLTKNAKKAFKKQCSKKMKKLTKKALSGKFLWRRKRKPLNRGSQALAVREILQEDEPKYFRNEIDYQHLKNVLRVFLLVAADRACCYNEEYQLVALPAIVKTFSPRPLSKFNLHCLAQPALTAMDLKKLEIEEDVFKAIKE